MRAVIFANGVLSDSERVRQALRPEDWVLAADGGTFHALAAGRRPAVVVGDLDSLTPELRQELGALGTQFLVYPARKDATDLELTLIHAAAQPGVEEILVYGALGGRWDQTFANVQLLGLPALEHLPVRLIDRTQSLWLLTSSTEIEGQPGDTVSLLPLGGDAVGVRTEGLEYPLHGETLSRTSSRGVSNVLVGSRARVWVEQGVVLIVHIGR